VHPLVGELRQRILSLRPPIFIVPHVNADVDAVASAVGLQSFLDRHGVESVLFFPSLSAPAAKLLRDFAVDYTTNADVSGKDVLVVDTSSSSMLPMDLSAARRVFAVDHHRGGDLNGCIFDTPSLSEAVAELLMMDGIRDRRAYALLAAGVYADTAGLVAAQPSTLVTLGRLLELAGMGVGDVARLVSHRPSVSERIARLKALRKMEIHRFGEFIVVTARSGAYEGSVAWLFVLAGADVALVAGENRVIARMSDEFMIRTGIDLTDLFSAVSVKIGASWGGHPGAAGMHVADPIAAISAVLSELEKLLQGKGYRFVRKSY